ncbi:MAG TPA: hypothetical protein VFB15_12215 [Candidatus Binataceae bacterium]|nr:hypothetical protein [Candidatus Binataceae bacterium]
MTTPPLTPDLSAWREFYSLIGSAAATLIGLMFVAASIGAGVFTRDHQAGIRSFLSPTVAHFAAVLVLCLIGMIPTLTWHDFRLLTTVVGVAGLLYASWVLRRMVRHGLVSTIDLADRLWYAGLPIIAYLLLGFVGTGPLRSPDRALRWMATALIFLLLIGIRNAWDMTVWIIDRRRN